MPDPQKLQSKISASSAQSEAERILHELSAHRDGSELIAELCARYTLAPRNEILGAWVKLARRPDTCPEPDSVRQFLLAMMNAIKGANTGEYFTSILAAATALSHIVGEKFVIGLMEHILITENSEGRPLVPSGTLASISRSVSGMGNILTKVLINRQSRSALDREFVQRWVDSLLPLLGLRTWGLVLDPNDAAAILEILATASSAILPDEALLICPRLIATAGTARIEHLQKSELFQSLQWVRTLQQDLAQQDVASSQQSGTTDTPASLQESNGGSEDLDDNQSPLASTISPSVASSQNQIVEDAGRDPAQAEFLAAFRSFVCAERMRQRELEEKLRQSTLSLDAARERLSRTIEESDGLQKLHDAETDRLKKEIHQLKSADAGIRSEIASLKEERDRWQKEVQLQDKEQSERIQNQLENRNKQLADAVSGATRNLRDHVLSTVRSRPDDRKLRLLALAFDTLHKRLLRLMGEPDSHRLPEEFRTISDSVKQDNVD